MTSTGYELAERSSSLFRNPGIRVIRAIRGLGGARHTIAIRGLGDEPETHEAAEQARLL